MQNNDSYSKAIAAFNDPRYYVNEFLRLFRHGRDWVPMHWVVDNNADLVTYPHMYTLLCPDELVISNVPDLINLAKLDVANISTPRASRCYLAQLSTALEDILTPTLINVIEGYVSESKVKISIKIDGTPIFVVNDVNLPFVDFPTDPLPMRILFNHRLTIEVKSDELAGIILKLKTREATFSGDMLDSFYGENVYLPTWKAIARDGTMQMLG